jgi:glycosyltransferase involved in cell wall biosynthesis
MRIIFVITNAPPLVGGLEKVCLRLAQNLQNLGHEVKIHGRFTQGRHSMAGYFRDTEMHREKEIGGVKVCNIPLDAKAKILLKPVIKLVWREWAFPLASFFYINALGRQLKKACAGSDVVHYFGVGREMLGFAAAKAARGTGAIFCVDPAIHPGQWGSFWIDAKLFRSADRMFCYSAVEESALRQMGVNSRAIQKVPCGFDYNDTGDGHRFREKHGIAGPMVLFLGRKTKEKGVERLLNAWPMVAEKFPAATLVIAGPKSEDFEKLKAESGNLPATSHSLPVTEPKAQVLNLDDLTEGEKQDALAACDLLCVPSEGESFGMVYFEAWAYKKPVVALDLPVLRETIGSAKAGILVKNDPREVAAAITKLLSAGELRRVMGANGHQLALQHKWEETTQHYLQGYAEALIKI